MRPSLSASCGGLSLVVLVLDLISGAALLHAYDEPFILPTTNDEAHRRTVVQVYTVCATPTADTECVR